MKVVIMAGGEGKRLRPLTNDVPKPLLPVGIKPIMQILIEKLKEIDLTDIIVTTHYKERMIRDYFKDGENLGVKISYSYENKKLGTAGPLKLLQNELTDTFLVVNGDILTKFNFRKIIDFHFKHQKLPTIGVIEYKLKIPYGVVITTNGIIKEVNEKPAFNFLILAGIYILNKNSLNFIPQGTYFDLPDLINSMILSKMKIKYFPIEDHWIDIGSIEEYEKAIKNINEWIY